MARNLIPVWLAIGQKNPWINCAYDPPFTEKSFRECSSFEELYDEATRIRWCLGDAFYHKDICLIQQVEGGDEWLVIKQNLAFESFTLEAIGREKFLRYIEAIENAPLEACKKLEYMKYATPTIENIIKHYEKNPDLIGYREKKVLNDISELLQLEKDQPGVYTLSGRFGSFQLTWGHPHYPNGTVVG